MTQIDKERFLTKLKLNADHGYHMELTPEKVRFVAQQIAKLEALEVAMEGWLDRSINGKP